MKELWNEGQLNPSDLAKTMFFFLWDLCGTYVRTLRKWNFQKRNLEPYHFDSLPLVMSSLEVLCQMSDDPQRVKSVMR